MLLTLITQDSIHTSTLTEEIHGMYWMETNDTVALFRYGFLKAKDEIWMLLCKVSNTLYDRLKRAISDNTIVYLNLSLLLQGGSS